MSWWLVALLVGLVVLAFFLISGGVHLLMQIGVIVHEAQRPIPEDHGSYSLNQGREVRPEQEQTYRR